MNKLELLQKVPTFARLTNDQLALLARSVGTQIFERDEAIFHQGSIGSTLFIIVHGQVRIFTTSEAGQELTVTIFRDGDFFGEMALLDGQPRAASAEAMCRTTTLTLHRAAFLHTIDACPLIAASVLEVLTTRLRQSNSVAEQLANLSASQRVVRQLCELATRYGIADGGSIRIDLHLTQDDLASLSGTTRETVNRVLANLRDQGLIRVERARVSVLKMQQLANTHE
ncbi:MAG TPA: Crp/Fnr family transcriptional regulator [Roseiflexaceae bacterium]|nr:Crp/Fnr family transcriptional regulator [Roseiflexaceae bacterium]